MIKHLIQSWRQARQDALAKQAERERRRGEAEDPRPHVFTPSHTVGGRKWAIVMLVLLLVGLFFVPGSRIVVALRWLVAFQIILVGVYWYRANLEKRTHESDALYIRPYGDSFSSVFTFEGTNFLQFAARRAIYPPHDIIYVLPPPRTSAQSKAEVLGYRASTTPYVVRTRNDLDWQTAVKELMVTKPVLIIECAAMSPGFKWELDTAVRQKQPEKIILLAKNPLDQDTLNTVDYIHQILLQEGYSQSELPDVIVLKGFRDRAFARTLRTRMERLVSLDEKTLRRRYPAWLYTRFLWFVNLAAQIGSYACIVWIFYILIVN